MKPLFTHDCNKCTFLGNVFVGGRAFNGKRIEADMWLACSAPKTPQYIFRLSDDGPDYICTPEPQAYLTI